MFCPLGSYFFVGIYCMWKSCITENLVCKVYVKKTLEKLIGYLKPEKLDTEANEMPPELRQFEVLYLGTVACTRARLVVCTGCLQNYSGADFR